ncbi:hypothetical protein GGS21DRAFT_538429 [Xylaria nigripes]|nr:hypothetical protein GGS21DRAFT_538429 [Xylaria nigripes]
MPRDRPMSNIDLFRAEITHSYTLGCTVQLRTLQRRIHTWNLKRRAVFHDYTPEIPDHFQFFFFVRGYKDTSIQQDLSRSVISISVRTVQAVRLRHGMKRRYINDENEIQLFKRLHCAVQHFGRAYLYEFLQTQAGIIVGKYRIYQYYKERWPEYVRHRAQVNTYHEGRFVVPGRNYLWFVLHQISYTMADKEWIYACIDAYSYMIIWIYVGSTACTALSTLKQFLRTIDTERVRLLFTRAGMGLLAESDGTALGYEGPNGESRGSSKQNQRIESWWRVFRTGSTDRWVRFAEELCPVGYINSQDDRNLIAIYPVYGSRIRTDIAEFVQLWNNYTIRRQKHRPYVVSGEPTKIYEMSEVNWGYPIEEGSRGDQLLRTIRYYLELQQRVQDHVACETAPHLKIKSHPIEGYEEYMTLLRQNIFHEEVNHLHGDPIPDNMLEGINDDYGEGKSAIMN